MSKLLTNIIEIQNMARIIAQAQETENELVKMVEDEGDFDPAQNEASREPNQEDEN